MTIQPLSTLASRSAQSAAAAAAAPREVDPVNVALAHQARIYLPVAEVIAREIAYESTGSLFHNWTLEAPHFRASDVDNWTTMFGDQPAPVASWRVVTRALQSMTSSEPQAAERGDVTISIDHVSESHSEGPFQDIHAAISRLPVRLVEDHFEAEPEAPNAAAAGSSSSPKALRDDSFRMIWGRIAQDERLHPKAEEETSVFVGFRGTVMNDKDGWAADLMNNGEDGLHPGEVRFHKLAAQRRLFQQALDYALEQARETNKKARILITGHSLGGSDCERFGALFAYLLAYVIRQRPEIRDRIAGITVVPFNSPGTFKAYGELFQLAAQELMQVGIEAICIDMKQHRDTVQKACGSRLSIAAPDFSTIIKMKNGSIGSWHSDYMTIQPKEPRRFAVVSQKLDAELSPLERAEKHQISQDGEGKYWLFNQWTGLVTKAANAIFNRSAQLQTAGFISNDEISDAIVRTLNEAVQTDERDQRQRLDEEMAIGIAALVQRDCHERLKTAEYAAHEWLEDKDQVLMATPTTMRNALAILYAGLTGPLPHAVQAIIDIDGDEFTTQQLERVVHLAQVDLSRPNLTESAAAAASQ
jgi:hypothetical protein